MSKREVRSKERPPKSRVLARAAGNGCGLGIDPTFSWLTMRILRPFSRDELSRTKDVYHVHATLAVPPWGSMRAHGTNLCPDPPTPPTRPIAYSLTLALLVSSDSNMSWDAGRFPSAVLGGCTKMNPSINGAIQQEGSVLGDR